MGSDQRQSPDQPDARVSRNTPTCRASSGRTPSTSTATRKAAAAGPGIVESRSSGRLPVAIDGGSGEAFAFPGPDSSRAGTTGREAHSQTVGAYDLHVVLRSVLLRSARVDGSSARVDVPPRTKRRCSHRELVERRVWMSQKSDAFSTQVTSLVRDQDRSGVGRRKCRTVCLNGECHWQRVNNNCQFR
jgi:hypothetical protein